MAGSPDELGALLDVIEGNDEGRRGGAGPAAGLPFSFAILGSCLAYGSSA
ncbi:hypothetical protein [Polyangium sp. y55x31]|nr:hypothetical protein [Polyangium sp. y55x31]MDI1476677.1 hypothetical protein [Polyangium sp. y55x31]